MTERVVLITGAARGIGRAVALRLAASGSALVLATRSDREGLERVADEARERGAEVATQFGDLAEPATARAAVGAAVDRFGRLDQLVSNAGYADMRQIGELDRAGFERAHATMAGALFELASAALPHLERSGWGRLVAISSFVAHVFDRTPAFPASAAAKAALEALVRALASQLAPTGATANAVAPGYVRKDPGGHAALRQDLWQRAAARTPLGRIAEPDDVAACVAFLLSRDARHITGQVIHVDGGLALGVP